VLDTVPGENGYRLYMREGWTAAESSRTMRCFRMAGLVTPPCSGNGWIVERLSFRGDAKHRTRNLEIPVCPSDHPGMTA